MHRYAPQCILPLLLFLSHFCTAQMASTLVFEIRSTGQVSGEIGEITIRNDGGQPVEFSLESAIIPPLPLEGGKLSQAYVTLPVKSRIIPDDGSIQKISLEGYSLDNLKPGIPQGAVIPDYAEWLQQAEPSESPEVSFPVARSESDFEKLSKKLSGELGRNFSLTYDIYGSPELVAALIFPAHQAISTEFHEKQKAGEILTPFPAGSRKEEVQVIQQSIWHYTSKLEGRSYAKATLKTGLEQQFEQEFGLPVTAADRNIGQAFEEGVNQIWSASTGLIYARKQAGKKEVITEEPVVREEFPELVETDEEVPESPQDCSCNSCLLVKPVSFSGMVVAPGDELPPIPLNSEAYPFGVYLAFTPPEIQVICNGCDEGAQSDLVAIHKPERGREKQGRELIQGRYIYLPSPGKMELETTYACTCDQNNCPPGQDMTALTIEGGPTCPEKGRGSHRSSFDIGNKQRVELQSDSIILHLSAPENVLKAGYAFNVEAMVVQKNHPVFRQLFDNRNAKSSLLRNITLVESDSFNNGIAYSDYFLFRIQDDEREAHLLLSADENNCNNDVSLLIGKQIAEYSETSFTPENLFSHIEKLKDDELEKRDYWMDMLFLGFQLGKGLKSDPGSYTTNYRFWKGKCEGSLISFMNRTDDSKMKNKLKELTDYSFTNPGPGEFLYALIRFIEDKEVNWK